MPSMTEELDILRRALLRAAALFGVCVIALLMMPIYGVTLAARGIEFMQATLVPAGVAVVALAPAESFIAQCQLAGAVGLLVALPYLMWEVWRFARPGLYLHERRTGRALFVSALALALVGGVFAYVVLIPAAYTSLYGFAPPGVPAFFSVGSLVGQSVLLMLVSAFFFLLPVMMAGLTRLGLVPARYWRRYWRHAVLLVIVVSAIITPDGSGVSMVLLALPICALYAAGVLASTMAGREITHH